MSSACAVGRAALGGVLRLAVLPRTEREPAGRNSLTVTCCARSAVRCLLITSRCRSPSDWRTA